MKLTELSHKSQRLIQDGVIEARPGGWIIHQHPHWNTKQTIFINDQEGIKERRCFCHQGKAFLKGNTHKMCSHLSAINYLISHNDTQTQTQEN